MRKENKMAAHNGRFGVSGGVTRLKVSANLQVLCPAQAVVSRHPRQAAGTLHASGGQCSGKRLENLKVSLINRSMKGA